MSLALSRPHVPAGICVFSVNFTMRLTHGVILLSYDCHMIIICCHISVICCHMIVICCNMLSYDCLIVTAELWRTAECCGGNLLVTWWHRLSYHLLVTSYACSIICLQHDLFVTWCHTLSYHLLVTSCAYYIICLQHEICLLHSVISLLVRL